MGAHPQRKNDNYSEEMGQSASMHAPESPPSASALLKQARQAQNKKIPAIARELKIAESYLAAIEEGNSQALPERVYTLGFVRTYSTYLGLDANAVVEQFKSETVGFKDSLRTYSVPEPYTPEKGPSKSLFFFTTILLSITGLAWFGYHFWYDGHEDTPQAAMTPAPQAPVIQETTPAPRTLTQDAQEHDLHVSHHPTFSQEAEDFARSLVNRFTDEITPLPVDGQALSTDASPAQAAQESAPAQTETPDAQVTAASTSTEPTILVFDQESWIQIRDTQGNIVVRRLFQAGQTYTLPHGTNLSLRVGNAGGVRFERGAHKSAPLGKKGEIVANVSLDPASLDGYLKPQATH